MTSPGGDDPSPTPAAAGAAFGDRLPLAERYARTLAGPGVERGLIGPREVDRLWSRHLLNCAVVADLLPVGARVVDVGSGAGLPGLVLAIRRPDVRVDLVEPMQRRCAFLDEAVSELGLADQVRTIRGRADDASVLAVAGGAGWVTARAVAPLDRLMGWCRPLLETDGRLLALKGSKASDELAGVKGSADARGFRSLEIVELPVEGSNEPTRVVSAIATGPARRTGRARRQKGST